MLLISRASQPFASDPERVAHDEALPFEPLTPNATTIQAMKDARSGLVTKAASLDALFVDLNADT
jgi:DNA-damage-inducible protein J